MVFTDELLCTAVGAVAAKRLQPRDLAVLMTVLANVNWRSGRANVSVRALAHQLQMQESNCSASVTRLRKEQLLARGVDAASGHTFFLINPRLASVGSPQRRGHLFQQFDEALE